MLRNDKIFIDNLMREDDNNIVKTLIPNLFFKSEIWPGLDIRQRTPRLLECVTKSRPSL